MRVIWSPEAEADRLAIFRLTASESVFAADALDVLFEEGADQLSDAPETGRPGSISATRDLTVHPNYKMVYAISADAIHILALVHTRRMWPPLE
jgi:toxin ParE1/3/4